ncbi:hypothetical protein L493_1929 [Bordetella bronchiseptica 99-R-0433]|nr:hypothetical protein L493_1929 [Bordetella bronchiseptica 99-R-0433]
MFREDVDSTLKQNYFKITKYRIQSDHTPEKQADNAVIILNRVSLSAAVLPLG